MKTDYPFFAIVTFGALMGADSKRSYYRSLDSAKRDLRAMEYRANVNARIVGCASRAHAIGADISNADLPVVAS